MMSPNIGFDASYAPALKNGTSVYSHNLLTHLAKIDHQNNYLVFPFFTYHFLPNFKEYQPKLPPNFKLFLNNIPSSIIKSIWQISSLRKLYTPKVKVFHSTTFSIPPKHIYNKLIVTIYDTTFYTHPQFHQKTNIKYCLKSTQQAVKIADKIIAISQSTKKDLINYFDCPASKIEVTYLACSPRFFKKIKTKTRRHVLKKLGLYKPFIFHLGTLEPRKNTIGIIKAYYYLPKKLKNKYDLVIGGNPGWLNNDIFSFISKHNLKNNIKTIGYVKDEDLPALYQSAACSAYPSFYEGFGIPVLEAMACGCPVLTTNISSIPEISGPNAVYCNPFDIEDISRQLKKILTQNNQNLIKSAKNRAKKFSWLKTARQTLKIYQNFL